MRMTILACLALLAVPLAALALPEASASPSCGTPDIYTVGAPVYVAVWYNTCIGAIAAQPFSMCIAGPIEHGPIHVYVLAGYGCVTGLIIS